MAEGSIDVVGSDHSPWPIENKSLPRERFPEVIHGMPGIETMLPVMYSEGVAKGRIDLPRMVELLCERPAQIFGLAPRKGAIAVGADADLVLLDPDLEWTVRAEEQHSLTPYSACEGWRMRGKPVMALVRGRVVVENGQLVASPGCARYLPRVPTR